MFQPLTREHSAKPEVKTLQNIFPSLFIHGAWRAGPAARFPQKAPGPRQVSPHTAVKCLRPVRAQHSRDSAAASARDGLEGFLGVLTQDQVVSAQLGSV